MPEKKSKKKYLKKLNEERRHISLQRIEELQSFNTIKERMDEKYDSIKIQLKKEYEVLIRNIHYSVSSKQLVEFINNKLESTISLQQVSVARCEIMTNGRGTSKGWAIVLLRSEDLFRTLKSMEDSLVLNGRKLVLKEGDGSSKRKRNVHQELKIPGHELHLGNPISESSLSFLSKWSAPTSDNLFLEVQGSSGKIIIWFENEGSCYKVEHSMHHIRRFRVEMDNDTNNIVISFLAKEPPKLYVKKEPKLDWSGLGLADLMLGMQSLHLWEIGVTDEENWVRTIDRKNVFGHCMMYRYSLNIGIEDKIFVKLLSVLREFSFIKNREIKLECCLRSDYQEYSFDENDILMQIQPYVPYNIVYLLHCLYGANKFDLQGVLTSDHAITDSKFVQELVNLLKIYPLFFLEDALLQCFSDPRIGFMEQLTDYLVDICKYISEDKENFEQQRFDSSSSTILMRRVLVTPLRICPQPREPEASNRVVRQFYKFIDHFIRVTFTDEDHGSILNCSSSVDIMEDRLRKIIRDGLFVSGRHFVFLAFSNSQIREQSCWFYDQNPRTNAIVPPTAEHIRNSIGDFSSIRVIGKHAARMGQGFSSTIPVAFVEARDMEIIDDVERNGYCFSDGVGIISQSFAERLSKEKLKLKLTPSAFQVRFGGGKGMLTVVPDKFILNNRQICFRPSMMKFDSQHNELEINSFSRPMSVYLNRQIISIFSSRGIKDEVFIDFLMAMIDELEASLADNSAAIKLLLRYGDVGRQDNSASTCAYQILDSGISVLNDPFLQGIIRSIRNRLIIDLRKKAKIHIPGGRCLLGVMDEFSILQEGEVFVQVSEFGEENRVISCPRVVVGRNPSLHPGDIRILKPRNIPELQHLVDVIVFPALGNRPHSNEMSGGDLDGDIYFVIEDESLIPSADYPPMSYTSAANIPKESESESVSIVDIGNFFVDYIINDNLGQIANSHMAHADFSGKGANCDECITLAQLHSVAVDFIKSGIPAVFPNNLRLPKYPHFMENGRKDKYESEKVLGKIYNICEKKIDYCRRQKQPIVVDKDLFVTGSEVFIEKAGTLLWEYNNDLWQIMRYYGLSDEMEALSGFVMSFSRRASPKGGRGGEDAQSRLNNSIHALKTRFRLIYLKEIEGSTDGTPSDNENSLIYSIRAQQIASAWYYCAYSQHWEYDEPPLISFPWIAFETLCEVKRNSVLKH